MGIGRGVMQEPPAALLSLIEMRRQGFDDPDIFHTESLQPLGDLLAHVVRHDALHTPFDLKDEGRPGLKQELNERDQPLGARARLQVIGSQGR
jgi:hypothetical protein